MIGIIVAMQKELDLLLPLIEDVKWHEDESGYRMILGRVAGRDVALMKCGIGKVNAALGASALIRSFAPEIVINTGVAGGTGGANVMDVIVGDRVAYHDVWCGPGTVRGEAAGCPLYFRSDEAAVSLPCLAEDNEGIRHGLVCSGDVFVDSPELVASIKENFPDVLAVDMESAAIAQTCCLAGVPFLCLRVLSDTPGEVADNASQYENFWELAPARTFSVLCKVLEELPR